MGFAFSKLWEGLFAADDNFKVRPSQKAALRVSVVGGAAPLAGPDLPVPAGCGQIVIVGLSNAGKTTILYNLHLGEVVVTQPTIGR